jgi:hypothetical protein
VKTSIVLSAALVFLGTSANVHAGQKTTAFVSVDNNAEFLGSPGDARASADNSQRIGCNVFANKGSTPYGFCFARDAAGNSRACSMGDATAFTAALASMTPASLLVVSFDANGNCTGIEVSNSSNYTPMTP